MDSTIDNIIDGMYNLAMYDIVICSENCNYDGKKYTYHFDQNILDEHKINDGDMICLNFLRVTIEPSQSILNDDNIIYSIEISDDVNIQNIFSYVSRQNFTKIEKKINVEYNVTLNNFYLDIVISDQYYNFIDISKFKLYVNISENVVNYYDLEINNFDDIYNYKIIDDDMLDFIGDDDYINISIKYFNSYIVSSNTHIFEKKTLKVCLYSDDVLYEIGDAYVRSDGSSRYIYIGEYMHTSSGCEAPPGTKIDSCIFENLFNIVLGEPTDDNDVKVIEFNVIKYNLGLRFTKC